jgi:hypothetical protein
VRRHVVLAPLGSAVVWELRLKLGRLGVDLCLVQSFCGCKHKMGFDGASKGQASIFLSIFRGRYELWFGKLHGCGA